MSDAISRAEEYLRIATNAVMKAQGAVDAAARIRSEMLAQEQRCRENLARAKMQNAPPVDRSARTLTDGSPVTDDHREIQASGMQKGYVVLSDAERAKGFVRPVRDAYRHAACNAVTTMGRSLAETYARDPAFYSGTFCSTCCRHFPVGEDGEFVWLENNGQELHKVGT